MAIDDEFLGSLRAQRKKVGLLLESIDRSIAAHLKFAGGVVEGTKKRGKHTMSKSARKKIAAAQRKRWAVIKKAEAEKKKGD